MSIEIETREDFKKFVSLKLRQIREKRGLSQFNLAIIECDIDQGNYSRYELAKAIPSSYNLYKICVNLGVSADEILGL